MKNKLFRSCALLFLMVSFDSVATVDVFKPGTTIKDFGWIAKVENRLPIPEHMQMKVVFDMGKAAKAGEVNRHLDMLARFINLHVAEGIPLKNIQLMMVVHGLAVQDLLINQHYQLIHEDIKNPNTDLIAQLSRLGVKIYVCGQSAASLNIKQEQLLPGVDMALSAMTAHAIASQQGYSLNPF